MQESETGEISHHNGIITAEGIDLSIESDSMSDKVSSETTMIGYEYWA